MARTKQVARKNRKRGAAALDDDNNHDDASAAATAATAAAEGASSIDVDPPSDGAKRVRMSGGNDDDNGQAKSDTTTALAGATYADETVSMPTSKGGSKTTSGKPPAAKSSKAPLSSNSSLHSFFKPIDAPATSSSSQRKPLSAEASELLKLELANMGADWLDAFLPEMQKPYFLQIKRNLEKERLTNQVFPAAEEIYSFTKYPLADIKVVILGQDPYHDVGQAHGLCFSVKKGVKVPPSLVNIYKEIKDEYPDFGIPQHGFLEGWSKQGVLLLNATLTVRAHNANSHSKWGWSTFTDAIISHISRNSRAGVVFILWGGNARKKVSLIDKKKHCVLESAHPSPLSAHNGFFGCGHFKKANEYLERTGREAIEWGRLE